jgi:hypothetical protein
MILFILLAFPVAMPGLCYDGVQEMTPYYTGRDVQFAYNSQPSPGHVWLLVDGTPIDSYYGEVPLTKYWLNPEKTFKSFLEMDRYIANTTSFVVPS